MTTNGSTSCENMEDSEALTIEQTAILKEFRDKVQDVLKDSQDDYFLLRWLRARKFNLERSEKMLRDHIKLRKHVELDLLFKDSQLNSYTIPEVFEKYVSFKVIGRDKEGNTIYGFLIGYIDVKGFAHSLTMFDQLIVAAYIIEKELRQMEKDYAKNGKKGRKFVVIFDLENFDIHRLMNRFVLKQHLLLLKMYELNYPETLKAVFVLNVPFIFYTWFNIAKHFIDERTQKKIRFYQKDGWEDDMLEIIDADVLPAFWGGRATDPDGDRMCRNLFPRRTKIPKSYYLCPSNLEWIQDDKSATETIILQRSFFNYRVKVNHPESMLRYVFFTLDYNIKYGVYFSREGVSSNWQPNKNGVKTDSKDWLVPLETVDCHTTPVKWQLCCEEAGTYVLHFDNSWSWMTPKKLIYKIELEHPASLNSQECN